MHNSLSRRISDRRLTILLSILFLISVIPLFWVLRYATPRSDDFTNGLLAHRAIMENRGFLGAIQGAWTTMVDIYLHWQGTYASVFLFALHPGVFGTQYYFLGCWFLLLSLIGSTLYLINAIVFRWLKLPKCWCFLVGIPVLISEIQFMPEIYSGVYWFTGASYYTLPYCGMQVLLGLMISIESIADRRRLRLALGVLLCALLGGGNYVTVLLTSVLAVTATAISFWKKSENRYRYLLLLAVLLLGFGFNAGAPGNLVRGEGALGHRSAVQSIAYSFLCGALLIYHRLRPGTIAVYLFIAPLALLAARQSKWKFRYPVLVLGYGFCVMCTQFTPYLYTGAFEAPPRMECIQFYFMHLWLLFSLFYFCGWLDQCKAVNTGKLLTWWQNHFGALCLGICALFLVGAACWAPPANMRPITTVAAAKSIASGQSKQAYRDFMQMEELFLDNPGQEWYIPDLQVDTNIMKPLRITASENETNYFFNQGIAEYYGCKKILLDTENS